MKKLGKNKIILEDFSIPFDVIKRIVSLYKIYEPYGIESWGIKEDMFYIYILVYSYYEHDDGIDSRRKDIKIPIEVLHSSKSMNRFNEWLKDKEWLSDRNLKQMCDSGKCAILKEKIKKLTKLGSRLFKSEIAKLSGDLREEKKKLTMSDYQKERELRLERVRKGWGNMNSKQDSICKYILSS